MNYTDEITGFYDWLETNDIPKSAVALWNALMHINNKTGWKKSFEVAMSTLEFKTKFKRSELFEARNILKENGRIKWESRGGNLCATYQILPFVSTIRTQTPTQTGTQKHTQVRTQKHTINSDTNTSINNTNTVTPNIEDVKKYFDEKGYSDNSAEIFFNYYNESGWLDRNSKPVKNWKQKAIAVWFKDENKKQAVLKPKHAPLENNNW